MPKHIGQTAARGARAGRRRWQAAGLTALAALSSLVAGCLGGDSDNDIGIAIGALVPFTGVAAAGGANYERAMLLAVEYLNARHSTSNTRFRMEVRDSHSSTPRTLDGLRALFDKNVIGLIGPERVELIEDVRQNLNGRGIAHVSPNSITLADFSHDDAGLLVRPAPAAEFVGCAMANRIYGDGNKVLVVLYSQDAYRTAFATAVVRAFESYRFAAHIGTGYAIPLPDNEEGYLETVAAALALKPDTVVVAADVSVGAALVRTWTTLTTTPVKWFFDPSLRSQEFLRNVSAASVAGATGISLALPQQAGEFDQVFRNRWQDEAPLVESYLYFDAVLGLGLAYLAAQQQLGRPPTSDEVSTRLLPVLRGPGTSVYWNQMDKIAELVDVGQPIHYFGAGGNWALDGKGLSDGTAGIFRFWTIDGTTISPEKFGACPAGTISLNP